MREVERHIGGPALACMRGSLLWPSLHASRPDELLLYDYDRHGSVVRHVKTWRQKGGLLCLVTHAGESWEVNLQTGTVMPVDSAEAAKAQEP